MVEKTAQAHSAHRSTPEVKQRFSRLQQQVLRPLGPDMPTALSRMQRRYSCDAHVFREGMNAEDTIAELDEKAIAVREITAAATGTIPRIWNLAISNTGLHSKGWASCIPWVAEKGGWGLIRFGIFIFVSAITGLWGCGFFGCSWQHLRSPAPKNDADHAVIVECSAEPQTRLEGFRSLGSLGFMGSRFLGLEFLVSGFLDVAGFRGSRFRLSWFRD